MQGDMGSIPGQGTNTAHAMWGQPKKSLFFFLIQFSKNLSK